MKWILLFTRRKGFRSAMIKDHSRTNLAKSINPSIASYNCNRSKAISKCFRSSKTKKNHLLFSWNPSIYQPKTPLFTYKPHSSTQTTTFRQHSTWVSYTYSSIGQKIASTFATNCSTKWKTPTNKKSCRSTSTITKQLPSTNWAGIPKPSSFSSGASRTKKRTHFSKT